MSQVPADADVRCVGLTKRFGDVAAVDGIDLEIGGGESFTPVWVSRRLTASGDAPAIGPAAAVTAQTE